MFFFFCWFIIFFEIKQNVGHRLTSISNLFIFLTGKVSELAVSEIVPLSTMFPPVLSLKYLRIPLNLSFESNSNWINFDFYLLMIFSKIWRKLTSTFHCQGRWYWRPIWIGWSFLLSLCWKEHKLDMVVGVSHHTTHMKRTLLVYFNNENDKLTIKKRCHDLRFVARIFDV